MPVTYNERVQALAEEMAKEKYPNIFGQHFDNSLDSAFNGQEQDHCINEFIPYARISVKHMADIWADCWHMNNPYITDEEEGLHYAKENGLISDIVEPIKQPEKEDWKL